MPGCQYCGEDDHRDDEACRTSRLMRDLFWARWGREVTEDPQDDARMAEIADWVCVCCPLPCESVRHDRERVAMLRGLVELSGGRIGTT